MTACSIGLSSCAQQSGLPSSATQTTQMQNQVTKDTNPITIDEALTKGVRQIQLSVGQELWINPKEQLNQWQVSLGRHDFAKVLIETNQQKIQSKMRFKSPGQYRLTINSIRSGNSQGGAAPNVMQQQITVMVKDQ